MRTFLILLTLAAPLAIPAALGEGTCVPTCEVASHVLAFAPPLTVVASGSTVTWTSVDDIPHTATDMATFCLHTDFPAGGSGSALFEVVDGALLVTSEGAGVRQECRSAFQTGGGFLLDYICLYHPNMRASVLVR